MQSQTKTSARILLLALALAPAGCIIPGINDENANADTARSADFGSLASPKHILPARTEDIFPDAVQLSWTNVPGAVSYDVHLGPDTNPPLIVTVPDSTYVVRDMAECAQQYWRVVATNADGEIVSSPVWSFKTRCP